MWLQFTGMQSTCGLDGRVPTRTSRVDAQTSVGERDQQLVAMRGRKRERHARDAGACDQRKAIAAEVEEVDAALLIDGRKLVAARIEGHRLKAE